jgi:hypothetical protein
VSRCRFKRIVVKPDADLSAPPAEVAKPAHDRLVGRDRSLEAALATAEHTWQALDWEANARVAMAEGDATRAQECVAKALSTTVGFEVPLAARRVHATATELYTLAGDRKSAKRHREHSRATIFKLANSLPADLPLRKTFLSAPAVRKMLSDR